jgi:hypothetical protein
MPYDAGTSRRALQRRRLGDESAACSPRARRVPCVQAGTPAGSGFVRVRAVKSIKKSIEGLKRLTGEPRSSSVPALNSPRGVIDGDPIASAIATLERVPPLELQRLGYHFQRCDFYSALNDLDFLAENKDLWQGRSMPAGIDWGLDRQLALLREIAGYVGELRDVPVEPGADSPFGYHWHNDFWRGTDALVHYALLRARRPARVLEIGCGWSSLLMAQALALNEAESGARCSVHQIEPYPRHELMSRLPAHWTIEEKMLQRASLARVEELRAGDVLFYDGSHVARVASDVNWFFFEILPRVAPGTIVHLHDIFWPADYPESWIFDRGQTWNEQYVLQAFLMFNGEFEVLLANSALVTEYPEQVQALLAGSPEPISGGGSVWLRRRSGAVPHA